MTDQLREKLALEFASLRAVDYDRVLPCDYETADAALDVIRKEQALQFLADEGQKCDAMQEAGAGAYRTSLEQAFSDGFAISGEGWNSEYPFEQNGIRPEDDEMWVARRDALISALEPAAPTVQEAVRDMDTAPRDGTTILLWMPIEIAWVTGRWDAEAVDMYCKWQIAQSEDRWNSACFTGWMPLPTPPNRALADGEAE